VRRWAAASLLVVASLFAGASGQWALACSVALLILGALAFGARLSLSRGAMQVTAGIAAVTGGALGWILAPAAGQPLREPWPAFVLAGLLAGAVFLCRRDGDRITAPALLPGLLALAACGEAPLGRIYALFVVVHLSFALLALRARDTSGALGRAPAATTQRLPGRRLAAGSAILGIAGAIAGGLAAGLPPLSLWTQSRILHALSAAETGFSDRMWLGSLAGMLQSEEVVLRVDGARTDYLRGAVFDHYEIGRWNRLRPARPEPVVTAPHAASPAARTRITAVAGTRDRYFLPLGAHAVATADPNAASDRFGILRVLGGTASEVSFEPDPSIPEPSPAPPDFPVAGPSESDLDVPPDLQAPLSRIAREWTAGVDSPEAKVAAIAHRLRTSFTYSLAFDHQRRSDPLLDFLLDDHRGHCEYFATALTLLSRSAGIPARVAVGYRVAEENALGGYWIVREQNAHAWSEIFLPGRGFVTVDATPDGAVSQNEHHRGSLLGSLWDLLGSGFHRAFADFGLLHLAGAFSGVVVVGLFVRWLRRERGPRGSRARQREAEKPPPSLERLLEALARKGVARPAWEPLERFAGRLSAEGMNEAAEVVRRWAAFRYGGVGDGDALVRETEGWVERLRR
jgi:transglutaminase-like putative cysteine protease